MDLDALKQTALEAAAAAGEIAKQGFNREKRIRTKSSDIDLVTEFDEKAQEAALHIVKNRYPDHGILAEEGFDRQNDSPFLWAIDPIDGTTNFAHNNPFFCVSIGLLHEGTPLIGVVYAPCLDELFIGVRGRGATFNGSPIAVSQAEKLSQSVVSTGFSYQQKTIAQNLKHFGRFLLKTRAIRRNGAAALDLCWVAMGRFDGCWELGLNPWDVTAGWLIINEAGGRVSDFNGRAYRLKSDGLLGSNGLIHDQMVALLGQEA